MRKNRPHSTWGGARSTGETGTCFEIRGRATRHPPLCRNRESLTALQLRPSLLLKDFRYQTKLLSRPEHWERSIVRSEFPQ